MRFFKGLGKFFWRFMVIFSFIVNFVLVIVLLLAGLFIFQIKDQIADPLIGGLHSTSVGLDEATIDWVIPVRDTIPVVLNIPLETDTTVVLTQPVPLNVQARIDLPGLNASNVPANVSLTLPQGLQLPVALDLDVPVNEDLDIALDVRAVIPISQTQLHDPFEQLGLLFEPLAIGLHNLPGSFGEVPAFIGQVFSGEPLDEMLLATDGSGFNAQAYDAWDGFSQTAGLNYDLFTEPYPQQALPIETGITVPGGIPALDQLLPRRAPLYDSQGNRIITAEPQSADGLPLPPETYNGSMADYYRQVQDGLVRPATATDVQSVEPLPQADNDGTNSTDTNHDESGIIPTPTGP